MTEVGNGGALRLPRARVVSLSAPPASYTAAVERYLTGAGIAKSSARIYRISLTTWGWMLAGEPAPTGPARRGAKPPVFPIAAIDDPVLPGALAELSAARADEMDADTVNRELSIARKAIGWWQRQGWIVGDPTIGIERRPAPPDRTKALAENQIAALWRLDVGLREKTQWKMLYESAARADEVLCLNVEDLYPQDKRGRITAKGGATEWIHWQSGTAQLLPRLIARRTRGPLFLTDRTAPAGTPTLDVCPDTGRARLSYRRAEEIFEENTRLLANPLASPEDIEELDGWTLHRLRHSALTHDAEGGTSTRCCWPGPAMPPSAPWSGMPAPVSTPSPGTSQSATPPHVAGTGSECGSTWHRGSEIGHRGQRGGICRRAGGGVVVGGRAALRPRRKPSRPQVTRTAPSQVRCCRAPDAATGVVSADQLAVLAALTRWRARQTTATQISATSRTPAPSRGPQKTTASMPHTASSAATAPATASEIFSPSNFPSRDRRSRRSTGSVSSRTSSCTPRWYGCRS
ncbi:site-specific integrase [Streptomyces sp. CC219B]|uniref:tyrosine-type recombinase/integrase n=1 Tax=Streptomyces sp. CC219B TaxID=3044574 RepID=UPI0024A9C68A|nr:site-specific integrase [Streptomyces sp. CC219B]